MKKLELLINDETITNIIIGGTTNEKIDDTLDACLLILPGRLDSTPFEPGIKARLRIYDVSLKKNFWFSVDNDIVNRESTNLSTYRHKLSLIALEKNYEKDLFESLAFTTYTKTDGNKKTWTVAEQLARVRNVCPTEKSSLWEATRRYEITNDPILLTEAPELQLTNLSTYEAWQRIMSTLDLIPKMIDSTLSFKKRNLLNNLVDDSRVTSESRERASQYYCQEVESSIDNAMAEYDNEQNITIFPSSNEFIGFRTEDAVLTTTNSILILPYAIDELKNVFVLINYTIEEAGGATIKEIALPYDITDFVFEKKQWDLLDTPSSWSSGVGVRNKYNTLYYTRGDNKILGFGDSTTKFGVLTTTVWENIKTVIYQEKPANVGYTLNDIKDLFRIHFVPIYETRITAQREDISDFTIKTRLPINLSDRTINIYNAGENLKSKVQMIGNADLTYTSTTEDYDDIFVIGDYTSDGYVVDSVEVAYFQHFYKFTAHLTKNYQSLSNYVGVNSVWRAYNVPREGLVRHLKYSDQILILPTADADAYLLEDSNITNYDWLKYTLRPDSLESNFSNYFILSSATYYDTLDIPEKLHLTRIVVQFLNDTVGSVTAGFGNYAQTFTASADVTVDVTYTGNTLYASMASTDPSPAINVTFYGKKYSEVDYSVKQARVVNKDEGVDICDVWATCNSVSAGNSLVFDFGFEDTILVYKQIGSAITGGTQQNPIRYTNTDGSFDTMSFNLMSKTNFSNEFTDFNGSQVEYPEVQTAQLYNTYSPVSVDSLVIDKDPSEILKMTYQIDFIGSKDIIIGKYLTYLNRLLVSPINYTMKVYGSSTRITETRKIVPTDYSDEGSPAVIDYTKGVTVSTTTLMPYWCLADTTGRVFLVVNSGDKTITFVGARR